MGLCPKVEYSLQLLCQAAWLEIRDRSLFLKDEFMKTDKLRLDTQVFLWWRANDPSLQQTVISAISDANVVFVSAATAWKAAIKAALG